MAVKIISGKFKGLKINVPSSARPTLQRSRQSLFDILESLHPSVSHGHFFEGKIILDCFAGSGALGIEALSRGAKFGYFIDASAEAIRVIHENTEKLSLKNSCKIMKADVLRAKNPDKTQPCGMVFIDPPYGKVSINKTIDRLLSEKWIDKNSLIVIENSIKQPEAFDENLETILQRTLGISVFSLVKLKS